MSGWHGAGGEAMGGRALLGLDARAKIVALFAVVVAAVSTPASAWPAFVAYWVLLAAYSGAAGVSPRRVGGRLAVVLPFVLLVVVFVPFMQPDPARGEHWVDLLGVQVSSRGLEVLANVLVKSLTSAWALILLSATTPFNDLLRGFERLHIPTQFVELVAFAWRYLFVLREEAQRMLRARDARAWRGRWLWQAKTIGLVIGALFLRAYERAERVYQAMKARGYDGGARAARAERAMAALDWALLMTFLVALSGIRTWAWLMR